MEKKSLRITVVAVMVVIVVVAAGAFVMLRPQDDDTIKIGVLPVIDTLPLYVAQEQGLFEKEGVNVKLVQFNSAAERDAAFTAGQIDGYFGDMVNTLVLKSTGQDVKVVTVDYHTQADHRMFALLASPHSGIDNISQISGRSIATSTASVSEYFLDEILEANGISNGKISITSVPQIPVRLQSLISGQVDLAILPEPFATQAINEGAKQIANDSSINTTASVIAFRGNLISEDLNFTKGFLSAYNESVALVNQDPGQYADILEKEIHFPEGLMGTFDFPPMSAPSLPSPEEVNRVQDWMMNYPGKSMLTSTISYESIMATELYA